MTMSTAKSDSKIPSNIQFQLILDTPNAFLSTAPNSKNMRVNMTGLKADQIQNIVECIKDAGPEAFEYLKRLVEQPS